MDPKLRVVGGAIAITTDGSTINPPRVLAEGSEEIDISAAKPLREGHQVSELKERFTAVDETMWCSMDVPEHLQLAARRLALYAKRAPVMTSALMSHKQPWPSEAHRLVGASLGMLTGPVQGMSPLGLINSLFGFQGFRLQITVDGGGMIQSVGIAKVVPAD